jgi:hypothetical protein
MREKYLARAQSFALVNTKLGLIEAISSWANLLHQARETDAHKDVLEVRHLDEDLNLGELVVWNFNPNGKAEE